MESLEFYNYLLFVLLLRFFSFYPFFSSIRSHVCIILFTALAATTGCRCGIEGTGDRIVGGTEVSPVSRITLYYCILSCIVLLLLSGGGGPIGTNSHLCCAYVSVSVS